jgi:hypothetical protein
VALLESEHPVESAWVTSTYRKHDFEIREMQGGLVDQRGVFQQRTYQKRGHCGQDGVQEEPRKTHQTVFEI